MMTNPKKFLRREGRGSRGSMIRGTEEVQIITPLPPPAIQMHFQTIQIAY